MKKPDQYISMSFRPLFSNIIGIKLFFFNLNQGPNPNKPPIICQIVQNEIDNHASKLKPILFTRIENQIEIPVKKVSDVLSRDVSHRFLKIGSKILRYELEGRTINVLEPEVFRRYSDILFELINYRWTQKLEECEFVTPYIEKG